MIEVNGCWHCGASNQIGAITCRTCRRGLGTPARAVGPTADTHPMGGQPATPGTLADTAPAHAGMLVEGSLLGGYELGPLLGEGAMGMVFKARKPRLPRWFAIKVLPPRLARDRALVARFEQEAEVQCALRHPNIVDVLDTIRERDIYGFVMELMEGPTLQRVVEEQRGPLPLPRCLAIMDAVLDAIGHAHDQDVIHRDLKPGNIMLQRIAGREIVKVTDFGLARILGGQRLTDAGMALGTALYMAPEQIRGERADDHRADLYSLGATLFELVTGVPPFPAPTLHAVCEAHLKESPPLPSALLPLLPHELDAVIVKSLAKRPDDRYQSAAEFRRALRAIPPVPSAPSAPKEQKVPKEPRVGDMLGSYHLDAKLGEGGMGQVFRATDTKLSRAVAVKVLLPGIRNHAEALQRFRREAALLAHAVHPNVVAIHELLEVDGTTAIVMELVAGRPLDELLTGALPPARCLELLRPVIEALEQIHALKIVHRDLKPSNIMVAIAGGREVVKVMDFGLALPPDGARLSATGAVLGTAFYMAPEQITAERDLDARADIYALGGILFEMLTGRVPFPGDNRQAAIAGHLVDAAPRPGSLVAGIPPALDDVVLRALAKDRRTRFQTARALLAAIEDALRPAIRPRRRRWLSLIALGLGTGCALAAIVVLGARRGGDRSPLGTSPTHGSPLLDVAEGDGAADAASLSLGDRMWAPGAFVSVGSPPVDILAAPVARVAYGWFVDGVSRADRGRLTPVKDWDGTRPDVPVTWVTQEQASAFCAAAGGHLPSSEQWATLAREQPALVVDPGPGEWTSTKDLDGTFFVRRTDDREVRPESPYMLPATAARDNVAFRCAR